MASRMMTILPSVMEPGQMSYLEYSSSNLRSIRQSVFKWQHLPIGAGISWNPSKGLWCNVKKNPRKNWPYLLVCSQVTALAVCVGQEWTEAEHWCEHHSPAGKLSPPPSFCMCTCAHECSHTYAHPPLLHTKKPDGAAHPLCSCIQTFASGFVQH